MVNNPVIFPIEFPIYNQAKRILQRPQKWGNVITMVHLNLDSLIEYMVLDSGESNFADFREVLEPLSPKTTATESSKYFFVIF